MNLFTIAWKSIRQRKLASSLTALSIALGVMLMVGVLVISSAIDQTFNQQSIAYQLIVGAKGGPLQLVLSSVYRIQPPIANLPFMYLQELRDDSRVEYAVPLAFGDFTRPEHGSFPIVGTTNEYFTYEYAPGKQFSVEDQPGSKQLSGLYDAVIGSEVARKNNWKVGDQFTIVHGSPEAEETHDEMFTVVAVLQQTGTPNDRSVFLNLEAVYTLEGHQKPVDEVRRQLLEFYGSDSERRELAMKQLDALEQKRKRGEELGDPHMGYGLDTPVAMKEITAVYVRTKSDFGAVSLVSEMKSGSRAMAVNPVRTIKQLMDNLVGNIQKGLLVLIATIIAVSGVSILVSIYNSMADRRREIGIMRALGARRNSIFAIILAESSLLCIGGGIAGWVGGHLLAAGAAPWLSAETGLLLERWMFHPWEVWIFPVLAVLGVLVGFVPAMTAYRTNVAEALQS
ncbi:MAG: ABC transporter permease [Fuerstiella sp.]